MIGNGQTDDMGRNEFMFGNKAGQRYTHVLTAQELLNNNIQIGGVAIVIASRKSGIALGKRGSNLPLQRDFCKINSLLRSVRGVSGHTHDHFNSIDFLNKNSAVQLQGYIAIVEQEPQGVRILQNQLFTCIQVGLYQAQLDLGKADG